MLRTTDIALFGKRYLLIFQPRIDTVMGGYDIRRRRQLLRGGQGENGGGRVRHDIFVLDDLSIMQLDRILEVNEGKEYYSPRVADLNQRCSVESANQ